MNQRQRHALRLAGIGKTYANGHRGVNGVDLSVAPGEYLVLVGPSGSGKSTVLRLLAGLETPTAGRVYIGDADVTRWPVQSRDIAMVFQSYALYPHLSVRQNMAYGLKVRGVDAGVIAERVDRIAQTLGIATLLDRRPAQLSGGERQRVALGRALVRDPNAFLFDEPLSNLDPSLRADARAELRRLHRQFGATIVHVTHDQEEALTLGDRVAVMRAGRVEQVATPLELYARPVNTFVAQFVGTPAMNLAPAARLGIDAPEGSLAGVRPHDLGLEPDGARTARVDFVESRGHDHIVHLVLDGPGEVQLLAVVQGAAPSQGARVAVTIPPGAVHLFDANGVRLR